MAPDDMPELLVVLSDMRLGWAELATLSNQPHWFIIILYESGTKWPYLDTLKYEVSRMGTPLGVNSRVLEWVRDMIVEP